MAWTVGLRNAVLDAVTNKTAFNLPVTHISLHTADPGGTGANEVTGNDYARVAVTGNDYDAAAAGEAELNNDKAFVGPEDGACTHVGFWNDTTFLGGSTLTGDQAFNAAGEYTVKATTTKLTLT